MQSIRPSRLHSGDRVGVIAPASNIKKELLEPGIRLLRQMGYEVVYAPDIFAQELYFAGSVERRMAELNAMLERNDVRAILCARGGYGSNYLLEKIDFRKFAEHPKIFMGYSDITSLLTAITDRTGLITFHGPMVAKDFAILEGVDFSSWHNALGGIGEWNVSTDGVEVLRPGRAQGRLCGGCLSMLAASLDTPFEIQTADTILFIEDVSTKPFQIDRMLTQLRLAGKFDRVKGFVFGEMQLCTQPEGQNYTLPEVIMRVLRQYDVPVVYGVKSGHVSGRNITLPIGVQALLVAESGRASLRVVEAATVA
ncbi:MAG: LD-carboxypeptidase [Acidobacteriia bacterium]|nr:LD-carboxypeptidase [Terriglobia bacterium]